MWSVSLSLFSVPFDSFVWFVLRRVALVLVSSVLYFSVSHPLRLFAESQSLQVNEFSFILLFSLFYFLDISSYFSPSFGHPLNFCHPLKSVVGGNYLFLSLSIMGVAFRCGIIPGVLFLVSLECTLGLVLTFAFVVGVD